MQRFTSQERNKRFFNSNDSRPIETMKTKDSTPEASKLIERNLSTIISRCSSGESIFEIASEYVPGLRDPTLIRRLIISSVEKVVFEKTKIPEYSIEDTTEQVSEIPIQPEKASDSSNKIPNNSESHSEEKSMTDEEYQKYLRDYMSQYSSYYLNYPHPYRQSFESHRPKPKQFSYSERARRFYPHETQSSEKRVTIVTSESDSDTEIESDLSKVRSLVNSSQNTNLETQPKVQESPLASSTIIQKSPFDEDSDSESE
jgi:hypothetical protein